jgi:hypothetical protein
MGARGSALSRAVKFFTEGDIHEAKFVLQRGAEIVKARESEAGKPARTNKRPAKRKPRDTQATTGSDTAGS